MLEALDPENNILRNMSSSLVCVSLRLLLVVMLASVPTMAPNPTTTSTLLSNCPLQCSCTTSLTCSDLGEQSRVIDFTAVVAPTFSFLQFVGRTKIRTIQSRAFSGLFVRRLKLDRSGVGDIERGAFLGVFDLTDVDCSHNHISGSVDSGTFDVDTALNSLNISDNDIESVSSNAFESVGGSSLRDLRLAGNRLRTLPDRVFANLTGLEHLDLSGNRLTNLTQPLFNDLLGLQRLFLANNRISSIDSTLFNYLGSLDHLTLDNNELTSLPASVFSQLTSLRTLTLQGNRLSSVYLNFFNTKQYPSPMVTLKLDRNRITNLTQVDISGLSSLRTLTLAANRLTAIPAGYFVGLSNITVLDLSRNNISSALDESSFEGLTSLSSLNLSSNSIPRISARTFSTSLRTLDLSKNDYLSYIESGVFENTTNLTNLYLRSNGLRRTTRGVFKKIASLENLDLSDSFITNVFSGSFEDLPNLRRVDLSKNNIYSISFRVFVNTSRLSHVGLDENHLSRMPVDIMNNLLNLRNFTLAHNSIEKLEALQSTSVDMLNLTGNVISDIVDGAFNGTPQIRELYLGQNRLTRIRASMFSGLNYLNHLDLSNNLISTIDNGSFQSMSYLATLSMHGNKLASIEPGTFGGLHSIRSLVLSANRLVSHITEGLGPLSPLQELILDDNDIVSFNVSYYFNFESGLQRLSLRRNRISKLQFNFHNYGFPYLSFLDFGENQITDEIFHSLQYFRVLRTLKLDGNDIRSVPTVGVLNQSLTELDLSNNALTDSSLATIVQLRRMQQLRLDGNSFSNLSAADWSILANSLSVLSLSNNRLTSLDQVGKLWSLKQLNVDNNLIESIPDSTFQPLYDLEVVSLRGNRLTTIGRSTLNGLEQKCTQLDLSSNYIGFIHPESFHRLKDIRRLNLSNNVVEELVLPPIMDQLTELLLSNNRLTSFPGGLYNLRSIVVLNLYNNVIESLPPLDIGGEFGVRLVDLSRNRLRTVDEVRFVGSLDVINIGENELADIAAEVLDDATFIRELNLSNNALGRLPVAVTLAVGRIARLYANRCSLTSLDNWVVATSPTTHLVELSLSGNRLTLLPSTLVASVSASLEHLDIRGNLFTSLNGEIQFRRLRQLSLAGNPWLCDCQLAWLRNREIMIDNATCWTPSATAGQHIICYDIDECIVPQTYEEEFPYPQRDICETIAPTDPPVVSTDVWPLHGPQAGGTLVTVTGNELTGSSQPVIVFISSTLDQFFTLSTTEQNRTSKRSYVPMVVGKTPVNNNTGEKLLVVVQFVDKPLINTTRYFVYRQNPVVADIFPLSHLLSGGTTVTVTGNNIDAAAQPIITVTVVVTRFTSTYGNDNVDAVQAQTTSQSTVTSEQCRTINSSMMTCMMPEVRLPPDFQVEVTVEHNMSVAAGGSVVSLRGGPDNRDRVSVYVGLQFDGFNDYANLTAVKPGVTVQFFQQPTFDIQTDPIVYRPESFSDIDIKGENLQRGSRITDYRVIIGNGECNVSSLSDNLLTCRPPYDEPKLSHDNPLCDEYNSVLVKVGNAGPFFYACIRYETEQIINGGLIVGIVVGVCVPVILLIVVIVVVVCICKRRRKEKQASDGSNNDLEMEMPPVVAKRPVECTNPAFIKSTQNQYPPGSYFEPIAGDDYLGPSTTTTEDSGYLQPDDDSSAPVPDYIVPLPSPPPSGKGDEGQGPTTSDANPTGPKLPDSNFEGDAGGEHYLSLSATNNSPDTYTKLQLQENNVENLSTDSVGVSSPLTDDDYHQSADINTK